MRSPLLLSMVSSLALLSGCQEQSTEANCRYYVQQALDNQQFDDAISLLDSTTCQESYPDDEHLVDLASAYLGKAGYSLPKILSAALEEDSDGGDSFSAFTADIVSLKNSSSLASLKEAETVFTEYLGGQLCKDIADTTPTEAGVCLIQGVIGLTKTSLAIDYLSGDIEEWVNNGSESIKQSSCALEYAYEYSMDPNITLPYACDTDIQVVISEPITFNNDKQYQHLEVTNATESQYFLQSTSVGSIVFTDNFCGLDFNVCSDVNEAACYVCPSEDGTDLSLNEFVLDSLNNGLSNIEKLILNAAGDDDSDLQESIDEFKADIGSGECAVGTDACFSMEDVINYLNKDK